MPILDGRDAAAVAAAADHLAAGGLVAFPTETVYGLGARADDDAAVAAIFAAKGRPSDHPLIVHVATAEAARHFGDLSHPGAVKLMQRFWPGPLTLIVPRGEGVAAAAAGGQASIGLRMPAHPVAQALLQAAAARGVLGVAAPSANRFGRLSPTCAAHVADELGPEMMVLDGGDCALGIESAIVDCTRAAPALLRPGVLDRAAIEAVLEAHLQAPGADAPRAPGTLLAHYAPQATLRVMDGAMLRQALQILRGAPGAAGLAVYSRTVRQAPPGILLERMPDEAGAAAHELFAVLRKLDAAGVRLIWVEAPPPQAAWEGVRDRLERAAAT
ncbi:MAG: threonylcarbamoyl-AMP synthase [Rubrivivax sp. SCN 71-131]|jgi:L-threonylcarbamoyladenylate synthase|nr:MAG: threonylcarbamoyl-AMP synthase [Rubrivivax sp. SCN 71-131]